jgi:hypothetical protein
MSNPLFLFVEDRVAISAASVRTVRLSGDGETLTLETTETTYVLEGREKMAHVLQPLRMRVNDMEDGTHWLDFHYQ